MKLIYWCAYQTEDHKCYNLRAKTRGEIVRLAASMPHNSYSEPFKVEVHYVSGFDLLEQCLSEGSIWERPCEE